MNARDHELSTLARYCVTKSPGFAAIALWVPYRATDEAEKIAWTDGRSIRVGTQFWEKYSARQQAFILMHEVLHVALRHIPRGRRAFRVSGAHALVWNLATDAVINRALSQMTWVEMPPDGVAFEKLLSAEELAQRPPQTWSAEALYQRLLEIIGFPAEKEQWEEWLDAWIDEHGLPSPDDLSRDDLGDSDDLMSELAQRVWASRLARARAGDRPGGLLRELVGDFPVVRTPWPQVLRSFLQDATMPTTRENFHRPGRRVLALNSEWFEPSFQPEKGIRRIGVCVDTSGSIDDAILKRFAAEVEAVQKRTGAELHVVVCDAEVTGEFRVPAHGRSFTQRYASGEFAFKGGGGTAFGPAISRLNTTNVKVGIYLTDMMGEFGQEKPKMPFLWCSTTDGMNAPEGFGRVIYLDPLD